MIRLSSCVGNHILIKKNFLCANANWETGARICWENLYESIELDKMTESSKENISWLMQVWTCGNKKDTEQ